jgi:HEAT repeat protein
LFKREDNRTVRLGCIAVLLNLNAWTNTIQALTQTTGDKDYLVRVRAITALQYVSQNHHEQLPAHVISLLEECLNNSSDNEILWQAAFIAGESRSQKFLPLLQNLLNNPSSKVQKYAVEAINKIKH